MSNIVKVILVDDHTILRIGLKSFLTQQTSVPIDVIGEAASGREALSLLKTHSPDVILLDLNMPELGGLETTIEIRKNKYNIKILILTQYSEPIYLKRLLEAGANGYILKSARGEDVVNAIEAIINGGTYIDPKIAGSVLLANNTIENETNPNKLTDEELFGRLTPREQQVLKLVAEGMSNKEMATTLNLSLKTVMAHRSNLMDKLGIKNRAKLIHFAMRLGLIIGQKSDYQ